MRAIRSVLMICAVFAWTSVVAEESRPEVGKPDSDVVQWRAYSDVNGQRFLTDGSLLLDSRYAPNVPLPKQNIPAANVQRLLQASTDRELDLDDLDQKGAGDHYLAPGPIQLNRKYIVLLQSSPSRKSLRLGTKGPADPVLIRDAGKTVGVMMPMKGPAAPAG